ncbi:MAG: transporter substrate-binding domain-containing protein [Halieaceae bacterium]|nr:transporter substrate-binding domain-containing protein [Halieaceae bacterium]
MTCRKPSLISRTLAALLFTVFASTSFAEPLRVALSPDYMPLAFMLNGELRGIEVDNAREVGSILGRPVQFVQMSSTDYIDALNSGKVDVVMGGYSITPERAAQVDFARSFMQIGQMAIILADRAGQFAYPRALFQKGVKFAVEPGTTGQAYVQENYPLAEMRLYNSPDEAFAALREQQVDVYVHDAPTSWNLASSRDNSDLLSLYRPLTREELAWAVKKGNTTLLQQLNDALSELEANGRLTAIQNYYIPVTVQVR